VCALQSLCRKAATDEAGDGDDEAEAGA